jgi:succinate dehydrogenase / fumarate reductase flavoprotein subunit/fumarate reductase (CoM/CoB) subunit A
LVETLKFETDVLVAGGGAAGMYAAVAAARGGARVVLIDKNVIGRGGGTIMAQMTCAAALGEAEPDGPEFHTEDTIEAGRGLCDENLAALLCENAPERIRELRGWNVDWAEDENGRINQVIAPGHGRKRCCYVDYLRTGAAISAALRNRISRTDAIRRLSNVDLTEIAVADGQVRGVLGLDVPTGAPVEIAAGAVVIATGGLTKLFQRTTASDNIAGEGIGLALRAGARLVDMEFVQFFPMGHLAPRLVGIDPTTWEPMRVKLGGRIMNSEGVEFMNNYGRSESATYNTTRDQLTYAIYKEVEAGRGSPHGGAFLSFEHLPEKTIRDAVGPVLDIFLRNGIDLTKQPVEVSPIAHYLMGGIQVNTKLETAVAGLYAAGEAAGGANGANRLSGNALPEAMVFGECAGRFAAEYVAGIGGAPDWPRGVSRGPDEIAPPAPGGGTDPANSPKALIKELKALMWSNVGPFRDEARLAAALDRIREMRRRDLGALAVGGETAFNTSRVEWHELRNGLLAAEAVTRAALGRRESRGAHQRDDFVETSPDLQRPQVVALEGDDLVSAFDDHRARVPA